MRSIRVVPYEYAKESGIISIDNECVRDAELPPFEPRMTYILSTLHAHRFHFLHFSVFILEPEGNVLLFRSLSVLSTIGLSIDVRGDIANALE